MYQGFCLVFLVFSFLLFRSPFVPIGEAGNLKLSAQCMRGLSVFL